MVKIEYLSGRTKENISRKLKYIFAKKTTPQLLEHIGIQNMKVGGKTNLGDLPQYFKFVRWMLTSSLKWHLLSLSLAVSSETPKRLYYLG